MSSDISQLIQTGLDHHRSGRLQEAESVYLSILAERPNHPDVLHLQGVLSLQMGKADVAVQLIESAIKLKPEEPEFYNMCGEAYRVLGNFDKATDRYEQALAINPGFAGAHINFGNVCKELGRLEEAVAHYEKAIDINPDFPMSYNNLGIALRGLGRAEDAIAHFNKAIALMPDYVEAYSSLGNTLQDLGRLEEAVTQHEKAIAIRPDYAEAHSNLGNALQALGRPADAIPHYRKAIAIRPDLAMAYYNLGIALDETSFPTEAITAYERALAINPDYAEAHHNLGNALDEMGRQDDAVTHYEQALAINPDYAEAYRNLSRIRPREEQVSAIETLLKKTALSESDSIDCHFALGNIYRNVKAFDKAFEHYKVGNALKRKSIGYDSHDFKGFVDRLIENYSSAYFEKTGTRGSDSELPVFIVGMPRSGTTLVEQIVATHPQVYGAGELAALGRLEQVVARKCGDSSPYPECMNACDETIVRESCGEYLQELRSYSPDAERVTDKMPANFMKIGFIKTLFPKARIIHCQRNALDTCTSNLLNYFAVGNEYSFDQDDLGQYYLDYQRLMTHWASLFASDILNVQYEELVMDQETVSRQLLEYLGLEWDDRCLDFHRNKRAVNSFSSMQVRQPVYASSIDRWKHYEKHLGPLIAILRSAASARIRPIEDIKSIIDPA